MKKFKYLSLILILIGTLSAQEILVKVGNIDITVDEFIQRYEFSPQLYTHMKNREEYLKEKVLYTLIAEKLWTLEAEELGFDTTDFMKYSFKAVEKKFVRDALYRQEIKNKVKISDEERYKALHKNAYILFTKYLFSTNLEEINFLWNRLRKNENFDSLLASRPENYFQSEPYKIVYGQMEESVEDSLYRLNVGEFSRPIKAPQGYYIFKLISKEENILYNQQQADAEDKKVNEVLRARKTAELYRNFYDNFFSNVTVKGNGPLIVLLSNKIFEILKKKKIKQNIPDSNKVYLKYSDLYKLENDLGNSNLSESILQINDKKITLKEFLYQFLLEGFGIDTLTEKNLLSKINLSVRSFAEFELLASEGFRRGLQNLPDVKLDIKMWRDNFLAGLYNDYLAKKSITFENNEIATEQSNLTIKKYKIIELLTNDLDVIDLVLKKLDEGIEFQKLAIEYTERKDSKDNSAELGYFAVGDYKEIGEGVANMKIGEIFGPIQTDEGYSIFQLVDVKDEKQVIQTDENNKNTIYKNYFTEKINKTVELALKYGIAIDQELLNSLQLTTIPMFTYRILGFGGRIIAVPLITPFTEWIDKWKESEHILP